MWIHWHVIPSKDVSETIVTVPHSTRTIANKNLGHTLPGRAVEQENMWTYRACSVPHVHTKHSVFTASAI